MNVGPQVAIDDAADRMLDQARGDCQENSQQGPAFEPEPGTGQANVGRLRRNPSDQHTGAVLGLLTGATRPGFPTLQDSPVRCFY